MYVKIKVIPILHPYINSAIAQCWNRCDWFWNYLYSIVFFSSRLIKSPLVMGILRALISIY